MFGQISRGAIEVDIRPYPAGMVDLISPFYLFAGNWKKKKKKIPPARQRMPFLATNRCVPPSHIWSSMWNMQLEIKSIEYYKLNISLLSSSFSYMLIFHS